jgi:2-amino-4-hydroxy-6-hydroxymethyldihydropteridine diphosphokinase
VRAHVGVGSNLGDRWLNLALAARRLREAGGVAVVGASRVYDSAPMGPPQPRYLNAVLAVETALPPRAFLGVLREVERRAHRRRDAGRWAARTLDLDLLLFGERVVREPGLDVPHPWIAARDFVLAPLAELGPGRRVPGLDATVAELLARLPPGDLRPVGLYPL